MKAQRISRKTYQKDALHLPVVTAVSSILKESRQVIPIAVFTQMGLLSPRNVEQWQRGQSPYLERFIRCNLGKAHRILKIIRLHATHSQLRPVIHVYRRKTKHGGTAILQFSKTGHPKIEQLYSTHYVTRQKPRSHVTSRQSQK